MYASFVCCELELVLLEHLLGAVEPLYGQCSKDTESSCS